MDTYTMVNEYQDGLLISVISEKGAFFCLSVPLETPLEDPDEFLTLSEKRYGDRIYKYFSGERGEARWYRLAVDKKERQKLFRILAKN